MKRIEVSKAQGIADRETESAEIVIHLTIPDHGPLDGWEFRSHAFFREEAKRIADVLHATLPGGTFDALIVALLTRKASHFRVSYLEQQAGNP